MQGKLMILLKENNLTQRWLSDYLGISEKQASKKLKGSAPFKDTEMFKLANYFNKTVEDIFLPSMYENGTNKN